MGVRTSIQFKSVAWWALVLTLVIITNILASHCISASIEIEPMENFTSLTQEESVIIQNMLIEQEGIRQFPYLDCCGKSWKSCSCKCKGHLTIGIGRNLDEVGISENEAIGLQQNDVKRIANQLSREFPWFSKINTTRRIVLISMAFNLGFEGFRKFEKMIKSIQSGDFNSAANQMLLSKWASQVKKRAIKLSEMMRSGVMY
jgi:lysozyme